MLNISRSFFFKKNKDCIFCLKLSPFSKHFVTQEKGDTIMLINCCWQDKTLEPPKAAAWTRILSPPLSCRPCREPGSSHYRKMGGPAPTGALTALLSPPPTPSEEQQNRIAIHRKGWQRSRVSSQNQKKTTFLHRELSQSDFPVILSISHTLICPST